MDRQPSHGELPPLDPELWPEFRSLLEAERVPLAEEDAAVSATKARVWSRLEATLGPMPPSLPAGSAPAVATALARRPLATHAIVAWAGGALLGALLMGGAWLLVSHHAGHHAVERHAIEAGHAALPSAAPSPIRVAAPTPAPAVVAPVVAAPAPPVVASPPPPRAAHPRPAARPPSPVGDLAAERALLDQARAQLRDGLGRSALATLRTHQRRFPHGQLVEERESLRIRALLYDGQSARANELLEAFHRRYPHSIFFSDPPSASPLGG